MRSKSKYEYCSWSSADAFPLHVAVIECGTPPVLAGSDFNGLTTTSYGSTLTVQCKDLYTLVGSTGHPSGDDVALCGAGAYWEYGDLVCEGRLCLQGKAKVKSKVWSIEVYVLDDNSTKFVGEFYHHH